MKYISKHDIVSAFRNCGIQSGDTLMLHSDAIVLAQTRPMDQEDRYMLFFEAMDDVLGSDGTLVIPTFTYSATKGERFYVEQTPSTVGALTEYFRKLPGVRRSSDPIFSVAVRGSGALELASVEVGDTFGPNSLFDLLHNRNAYIACLGCSFDRVTFTHYVEQSVGVSYRYFKAFPYTISRNGSDQSGVIRYYVRYLDRQTGTDLSRLKIAAAEPGFLHKASVGRFALITIACQDFYREAEILLRNDESALITEGRE